MMLLESLILDFVSCVRSLYGIARYSFSPFKFFPIGFFLEGVLMRPSWGLSKMVLFRQSHLDSLDRSFVIVLVFFAIAFSCIGLILVT